MPTYTLNDQSWNFPQWRREYVGEWASDGAPREDSDAIEIRMRSYAAVPQQYIVAVDAANGVITLDDRPASGPEFNEVWIQENVNSEYADSCWSGGCDSCRQYHEDAKQKWKILYASKTATNWAAQWTNVALAHAAAVFCLEVIYDGKEHRVVNADAIRAAIST